MAVSEIHGIYAASLFTADMSAAVILDAVAEHSLRIDSNISREATSGAVYPRATFISGQQFSSNLTTYRLDQWFDEVGFTGKLLTTDTGKPGITLYAQKFDASAAGRATGSNHRTFTIADGFIVPRRLTVDHQGDAMLFYDLFITYDGNNDPIVVAESQALPTLSGDEVRFTIGSCKVGNVTVGQIQSLEVDFGVSVRTDSSDSDIYPTHVSVEGWQPTITLRGVDSKWFGSSGIGLGGLACTHANTEFYLRKRAQAGNHFVADGDSEHIKLTADGLATITTAHNGRTGAASETEIQIMTEFDGTNAPIVITTASAIS